MDTGYAPQVSVSAFLFPGLCFTSPSAPQTLCGHLGRPPAGPAPDVTPGYTPGCRDVIDEAKLSADQATLKLAQEENRRSTSALRE